MPWNSGPYTHPIQPYTIPNTNTTINLGPDLTEILKAIDELKEKGFWIAL